MHFCYSHLFYGGHVNGGYLHFLKAYLVDIPLGDWCTEAASEVARLVRQREQATVPTEQCQLEQEIDRYVGLAFGVSPTEAELLQRWIAEDDNWQFRDRIRAMK